MSAIDAQRITFRPAYRYHEYKYVVPPRSLSMVRRMLAAQSVDVDPYPEGLVRSIYYDTIGRVCLGQCRDGARRKIKFRIRRYDEQSGGQLQIKLKDGFAVAKLKRGIDFPERAPSEWPRSAAVDDGIGALGLAAATLRPVIDVRYRRERFLVRDYRVTLDSQIAAASCDGLIYPRRTRAALGFAVLEVKTRQPAPVLPPGIGALASFASMSKYGVLMRSLLGEDDVLCKYRPY